MANNRTSRGRKGRTPKRPAGMVVRPDFLSLTRPWTEPGDRIWLLLLYASAVGAASFLLAHTAPDGTVPPEMRAPVAASSWLFIVLATWSAAAMAVNRTTVRLAEGWLSATHHPLYWPGGQRFRAADVEGVTVREDRSSAEDGPDLVAYRILVGVRGAFPRTLVSGISEEGEAEYIRQRLLAGLSHGEGVIEDFGES